MQDEKLEVKKREELITAIRKYKLLLAEIYDIYPRHIFMYIDEREHVMFNCYDRDGKMILIGSCNPDSDDGISITRVEK